MIHCRRQSSPQITENGWNQGSIACAQSTYTFSFELSSKHQQNIACGPQVEMERTTKVHLKTPFHTPQPIAWPSNSISSSGRFLVSGIQQASNKAQKAKKAKTRKEPKPRLSSKTWSICRLHQLQTKGLPWDSFKPWINRHQTIHDTEESATGRWRLNYSPTPFASVSAEIQIDWWIKLHHMPVMLLIDKIRSSEQQETSARSESFPPNWT